jgi:hypothetical protein
MPVTRRCIICGFETDKKKNVRRHIMKVHYVPNEIVNYYIADIVVK